MPLRYPVRASPLPAIYCRYFLNEKIGEKKITIESQRKLNNV